MGGLDENCDVTLILNESDLSIEIAPLAPGEYKLYKILWFWLQNNVSCH